MRSREPSDSSGFGAAVRVTPRHDGGNHKTIYEIGARSTQRESNRDPGGRNTSPEVDPIREQVEPLPTDIRQGIKEHIQSTTNH